MVERKKGAVRIQVIFTRDQYDLIQKLKGELGMTDSEVIRNIVLGWLMEKSFLSTALKTKMSGGDKG
jgi:hypothetical protein